jgi:hypothetical protein
MYMRFGYTDFRTLPVERQVCSFYGLFDFQSSIILQNIITRILQILSFVFSIKYHNY